MCSSKWVLLVGLCAGAGAGAARAATIVSVQSGAYADSTTWDLGVPGPDDDVRIVSPHVVTLPKSATCASLELSGTLRSEFQGADFTVTGDFRQSGGVFDLGQGNLGVGGDFIRSGGTFAAIDGNTFFFGRADQRIDPGAAGTTLGDLELSGAGFKLFAPGRPLTVAGDLVVSAVRLGLETRLSTTVHVAGNLAYDGFPDGPNADLLVVRLTGAGRISGTDVVATGRAPRAPLPPAERLDWRTDPASARARAGADDKSFVLENTFARRREDVARYFARQARTRVRIDLDDRTIARNVPGGTAAGGLPFIDLQLQVAPGAEYDLATDIILRAGRTLTVNGTLHCEEFGVFGDGDVTVNATGRLGTRTTDAAGLDATLQNGGTNTFIDAIVEYEADAPQTIHAAAHPAAAMIYTSGLGTKTLDADLEITGNSGAPFAKAALRVAAPSVFADGGNTLEFTTFGFANVVVDSGATFASSPGGGLVYGPSADGSGIVAADGTAFGDLDLQFASAAHALRLFAPGASDVAVSFRNVRLLGIAGGLVRLSQGTGSGATHVTVQDSIVVAPGAISASGGGFGGTAGKATTITALGSIVSQSVNPIQSLVDGVGTNQLILSGTERQSLSFDADARVLAGASLVVDNDAGVQLAGPGPKTVTIAGRLRFESGNLITGGDVLAATGVVEGTGGFVAGRLRKPVATGAPPALRFEIGPDATRPLEIDFAQVTAPGSITVATVAGAQDLAGSSLRDTTAVLRRWTIERSGVLFTTCDLTLPFLNPADLPDPQVDPSGFVVARRDNDAWTLFPPDPGTGPDVIRAAGVRGFGDFFAGLPCAAIALDPLSLPRGSKTVPYPGPPLGASGGSGDYVFTVIAGTLPPGVTLDPSGEWRGTPTSAGDHAFTVQARDRDGCTGARDYTIVVGPPPVSPAAAGAAESADRRVTLRWQNPVDADFQGVLIRFASDPSLGLEPEDGAFLARTDFRDTTFVHSVAGNGVPQFYNLFAFDRASRTSAVLRLTATPLDSIRPGPVLGASAEPGDEFVQLAWTNPDDADFRHTRVEFSTDPGEPATWTPVSATGEFPGVPGSSASFRHANLANEVLHRYRWTAVDDDALESDSVQVAARPRDVTPPGPVPSLVATQRAAGAALGLAWTLPRDPDLALVVLRRSTSGFPADPTAGDPVGPGEFAPTVTAVVDSPLTNDVRYFYSIFARDEVPTNFSAAQRASEVPRDRQPPPPLVALGFVASAADESVNLSWPGLADADFAGTQVRFATDAPPASPTHGQPVPNGNHGDFPRTPDNTYTFTHSSLVNGRTVFYSAFTFDASRNFSFPRQASATPADRDAPDPPSVEPTAGDRSVTLVVTTPSGARNNDLRGVVVLFSTTAFPPDERTGTVLARYDAGPSETRQIEHRGLTNGTPYFYSAFTFDEVPNFSLADTTGATPDDPAVPGRLAFFTTVRGDRENRILWTNPPDLDFFATRIEFEDEANPGVFAPLPDSGGVFRGAPGATASALHGNLENGRSYSYRGFAIDDDGRESVATDTLTSTPLDTLPPGAIRAFSATPLPEGRGVRLAWTLPADAGEDDFFAVIAVSTRDFPVEPADGIVIGSFPPTVTRFDDGGRANGVPLFYTIWSRDEVPSNLSAPRHATATPRDVVPPVPLATFTAEPGDGIVTLRWTPPDPPTDYARTHLRFSTTAPPARPVDGEPVPGPTAGFFGPIQTSAVHSPVSNGVRLYYSAFAVDADSNFAAPRQLETTPADLEPPAPVLGLQAAEEFATITLTWTHPTTADFAGVLIRSSVDSTALDCPGPQGGTLVARILAEPGTSGRFVHRQLVNETRYFYSVTAFDDETTANLSEPQCVDRVAGDHTPPGRPPSFVSVATDSTIVLTWTNPGDADFAFTKIVFSNEGFVQDPEQAGAFPVPNGAGGIFPGRPDSTFSFAHRGLAAGPTFFYSAFAFDNYLPRANRSGAATTSAQLADLEPPGPVVAFQATAITDRGDLGNDLVDDAVAVALAWSPPDPVPADYAGVLVRFSTIEPPRTPTSGLPFPNDRDGRFGPEVLSARHEALVPGVRYFYSAFAFDSNPRPNHSDPRLQNATPATEIAPVPLALAREGRGTFPNLGVYQMVSVPYDLEPDGAGVLRLSDVFAGLGRTPQRWRGFSWTGIDSAGIVVELENPPFAAGRGYWLISQDSLQGEFLVTPSEQPHSARRSSVPRLQLEEGWNIVGAPLVAPPGRAGSDATTLRSEDLRIVLPSSGRSLTLAEARDERIIDGVLYDFTDRTPDFNNRGGSYLPEFVEAAVLRAWRGRLLYAYQPCELCYFCGLVPEERSRPKAAAPEPALAWHIDLVVASGGHVDDRVRVGVATGASNGWDVLDHPKPPPPASGLVSGIEHTGWDERPILYRQSIGDPSLAEHRWTLRVRGAADRIRIVWSGTDSLTTGLNAFLVLPVGAAVPMGPGGVFEGPAHTPTGRYEILVTDREWSGPVLRSGDSGLLPLASPQRAGTVRIVYQLASPVRPSLRVFDVRGRVVREFTGLDGSVGMRTLEWDGRSDAGHPIASGVYIVDLGLGGRHSTGKVVLVR